MDDKELRMKESEKIEKRIDEICDALDDLALENLELLEEKIQTTIQLENLLRQGHIELAKARYIRGKESVGLLQVPSEETEVKSMFDLETSLDDQQNPTFDISLKKTDSEAKDEELPQDPVKWFGVLVPQSLKFAQKHFQEAVYVAVKLANIQAKLDRIQSENKKMQGMKEVHAIKLLS